MDYEKMWNKLKSTLALTHENFMKKEKYSEAGTIEFVLDEMINKEEIEELLVITK